MGDPQVTDNANEADEVTDNANEADEVTDNANEADDDDDQRIGESAMCFPVTGTAERAHCSYHTPIAQPRPSQQRTRPSGCCLHQLRHYI
jgi:hypothetical protein